MGLRMSQRMQQRPPEERRSKKKTKQQKHRNSYRSDEEHSLVPLWHTDTHNQSQTVTPLEGNQENPSFQLTLGGSKQRLCGLVSADTASFSSGHGGSVFQRLRPLGFGCDKILHTLAWRAGKRGESRRVRDGSRRTHL